MMSKEKLCEHMRTCSKASRDSELHLKIMTDVGFISIIQKGKQN